MASKLVVSGPVALFVKHAIDSSYSFLGFGEKPPEIHEHAVYKPITNDEGGSELPVDSIYCGTAYSISVGLSRCDQGVLNIIKARSRSSLLPNIVPGYDPPGAIGSLVSAEGAYFSMIMAFLYSVKAPFQGMPAGFRFFQCVCPETGIIPGSTNPLKNTFSVDVIRQRVADQNAYGYYGYKSYDIDVSAVAGISVA